MDFEENDPIVNDLTRRGYATWNIEYRRKWKRLDRYIS
jgi:hypothetical protein